VRELRSGKYDEERRRERKNQGMRMDGMRMQGRLEEVMNENEGNVRRMEELRGIRRRRINK